MLGGMHGSQRWKELAPLIVMGLIPIIVFCEKTVKNLCKIQTFIGFHLCFCFPFSWKEFWQEKSIPTNSPIFQNTSCIMTQVHWSSKYQVVPYYQLLLYSTWPTRSSRTTGGVKAGQRCLYKNWRSTSQVTSTAPVIWTTKFIVLLLRWKNFFWRNSLKIGTFNYCIMNSYLHFLTFQKNILRPEIFQVNKIS